MIFDLLKDYADVLDAMPKQHPRRRILKLLDEAIRRDAHFIDRHPTTLFQCLWNTCWWYDCPEAQHHYKTSNSPTLHSSPNEPTSDTVAHVLECWRTEKHQRTPAFVWLRSLRPPQLGLVSQQLAANPYLNGRLHWSPDGNRLILVKFRSVEVWNLTTSEVRTASEACDYESVSSNGLYFAAFRSGERKAPSTVRIIDVLAAAVKCEVCFDERDKGYVNRIAVSHEGDRFACNIVNRDGGYHSPRNTVVVLNTQSEQTIALIDVMERHVHRLDFSPDGAGLVIEASEDMGRVWGSVIRVWRETTKSDYAITPLGRPEIVEWSHNGMWLFLKNNKEDAIRIYDAATGDLSHCLDVGAHQRTLTFIVSPSAEYFIRVYNSYKDSKNISGTLQLWDAKSRADLGSFTLGEVGLACCGISADGSRLAIGLENGSITVWKFVDRSRCLELPGHEWGVSAIAFSPDGNWIASSAGDGVRVWNAIADTESHEADMGHSKPVEMKKSFSPLVYRHDGLHLVSFGREIIQQWNAVTGIKLSTMRGPTGVTCAAYSPDGMRLACGAVDVCVYDLASGVELFVLSGHEDAIESIAYSDDGLWLATGSADHTVRVWEALSGECVAVVNGKHNATFSKHFGVIGHHSVGHEVRVSNRESGDTVAELHGHNGKLWSAAFSNDEKYLVTCAFDNTVRIWDVATWDCWGVIDGIHASGSGKIVNNNTKVRALEISNKAKPLIGLRTRDSESVLETISDVPIGHCPAIADAWTPSPRARRWSGKTDTYLYMFELEGEVEL